MAADEPIEQLIYRVCGRWVDYVRGLADTPLVSMPPDNAERIAAEICATYLQLREAGMLLREDFEAALEMHPMDGIAHVHRLAVRRRNALAESMASHE